MPNPFARNMIAWRVLLLRRNASEGLAVETERGLCLPEIEIPEGCRVARSLNEAIKDKWGIDAYSLYPLDPAGASPIYVIEALSFDAEPPESSRWLALNVTLSSEFSDPADFEAIRRWRHKLAASQQDRSIDPFAEPGWLPSCQDWVAECLQPIPLTLTGVFLQCNASPTFSLIRFETDGAAAWFKAVGEPNLREYAVTSLLCTELPAFLPRVLGAKPEWHAWVALEADGTPLSQTSEFPSWRQAARDLAAMQKESRRLASVLLQSGARDIRTNALCSQIDTFVSLMRELMARQVQERPSRLTNSEIDLLEEDLRTALQFLQHDGTPDSLLHLDLHPDNVIAGAGKTVFLDWAEVGVGHPFLSFAYFLEHFRRQFTNSDRLLDSLAHEYLSVWNSGDSLDTVRTLSASALAAVFAYAISIPVDRDKIFRDHSLAGYFRSLARRMKRYGERAHSETASFREVIA